MRVVDLLRCAVLLVFGIAACAPERQEFIVVLPEAPGIREGSPIDYLGIQIGEVTRVVFVRDSASPPRVAVHIRLSRDSVPLRVGDSVQVRTIGIFGDQALSIAPGPSTAPRLSGGDTLIASSEPVARRPDLGRFLEGLTGSSHDSLRIAAPDSGRQRQRSSPP